VHRRFARNAEAARELRHGLALDPACAEAHYLLGILALAVCDYPVAERHLRDAFDSDPRWADVPVQLAQAQISQDKLRDAVSTLETYLKLDPKDAEAWCELGQVYQRLGDWDNAKRCHLTAIDVAPDFFNAYYGAAQALRELGAAEESKKYLDKFRQMRTSETETVRVERAKATDEDFKRRAVADMATQAGALYALHGYLHEAEKCWMTATTLEPKRIECLEMLCRLRPNDPERCLRLGHAYIQDGRPSEAEAPFQRAIELAPLGADGYAALAQVHMLLGKNAEKAADLAQTAVKLEATAANYFVLAAACERTKDWSGAKSALEHAIELDPDDPIYQEAYDKLKEDQW
jgi:tetratricopeptide (TPR) repeat protein